MSNSEFLVPAEWVTQRAIWVGWPRLLEEWGEAFASARREIAAFVRELSKRQPVKLAAGDSAAEATARKAVGGAASILPIPTGDIWLRDTGPVFTVKRNQLRAETFGFNGWGGKFDMPGDRETAGAIAGAENLKERRHDFVLEGGALDHDGQGTVLTTRECLLNANRNGWSEAEAETALAQALGVRRIIWLERGLANDHTDGHIDNVARFIAPGRVVCQRPTGPDDPQADRLGEAEDTLRAAGLDVVTIPSPGDVFGEAGESLPASHMNFVFAAGEIFLPVYSTIAGAAAAAALADACPGWRVTPLASRAILDGGGSFHCMTCNIPELPEPRP